MGQGLVSRVAGTQQMAACADLRLGAGPLPGGPSGQGSRSVCTPVPARVVAGDPQGRHSEEPRVLQASVRDTTRLHVGGFQLWLLEPL